MHKTCVWVLQKVAIHHKTVENASAFLPSQVVVQHVPRLRLRDHPPRRQDVLVVDGAKARAEWHAVNLQKTQRSVSTNVLFCRVRDRDNKD